MQGKKEEKTNYSTIKIADDCVLTQEKVEPEVFKLLKSYFKKPENVLDIILNNKELSDEVVITNLTTLNLKANRFGDDGAIAIGKNTTWTVLATLDLHFNAIGDEGAITIGKNTTWKKLITLDVSYNKIGDKGTTAIGENTTWTKLTGLNLSANKIDA